MASTVAASVCFSVPSGLLAQAATAGVPAWGEWESWGVLLVALGVAVSPVGRALFRVGAKVIDRIAANRLGAMTLVGLLSLGISAGTTLLMLEGFPRASVHDEFSYLLAGETFAHGRLTNPPHPMWRHLETIHVLQQPTYMSKYPPGQGAVLALGIVVAGEPIVGVWVVTALACAAVCWALYAWGPGRWAVVAGVLCAVHPSVLGWTFVYWGGAGSMLGAALVLGAVGRLLGRVGAGEAVGNALVLALGLGVLANTRPLEGVLVSAPLVGMLLASGVRRWKEERKVVISAAGVIAVVMAGVVSFMGYYNSRVTGSAGTPGYVLHDRTYNFTPHFVFQGLRERPEYRHEALRRFHGEVEAGQWEKQQSFPGWGREAAGKVGVMVGMGLQPIALLAPLLLLPIVLREEKRLWWLVGTVVVFVLGEVVVTWGFWQHYAAPVLPIWMVLVVACLRRLAEWEWRGREVGAMVVRGVGVLCVFAAVQRVQGAVENQKNGWQNTRAAYVDALNNEPGEDLVVVRYLPGHDVHAEWVYNGADIDAAPVVWARDMGEEGNRALFEYFKTRRRWLLEVDGRQARLVPYPG